MTKLRDLARGQECTMRLFPPCDPETTTAHHYHRRGHGIVGGKVSDLWTVHCCAACHSYAHTHPRELEVIERTLAGMIETQGRMVAAGYVRVG